MIDYLNYIENLDSEGKICLKGKYWDKFFTIITGSKKRDNSIMPNPLVLTGWHYSDDDEKAKRFRQHLIYAFENNRWEKLLLFMSKVPEEAWHRI